MNASQREGEDAANRLGVEPVGKLLLKFSMPAITGMVVNALYNVVDRIFVGRGVGELALGGLSLAMPLMTVVMAFAMLFGVGTANMVSIRLGQKLRAEAENALNHCFYLLLVASLLIMAAGFLFLEPLLLLVGAQPGSAAFGYAKDYLRIIFMGTPVWLLGFGFSHCTRAQGFPAISMISMFVGAGMNTILDPIFIFVFKWGVQGAALATIISQCASCVWILYFSLFSKKAVIRLSPLRLKPSFTVARQIMAYGSAQFLLQFGAVFVQVIYNISLMRYGNDRFGSSGGDVALAGMNIVNSISMMILMPVFGINQGAQPLLGYNYGAKRYDRVLRTYLLAIGAATSICILGFILAQGFPNQLVRLFAPEGSDILLSFAPHAMRVVLMMLPFVGPQVVSSNFFVATGRPHMASMLSLSRQVLVLIPCLLLFGSLWGFDGIIWASPVSDGAATILTGTFIGIELKRLRREIKLSIN